MRNLLLGFMIHSHNRPHTNCKERQYEKWAEIDKHNRRLELNPGRTLSISAASMSLCKHVNSIFAIPHNQPKSGVCKNQFTVYRA